jgi:large subunit ribosomal protein L3
MWEFRVDSEVASKYEPGTSLTVELFEVGQKVDVRGTTIGRGFAGVMRRHGFRGGRATHGNSKAHRKPGSIGQNQDPGRVFKGKKMAGHMGNVTRTQQNLEIHQIDIERGLILIRGSVPGPRGRDVLIEHSVKYSSVSER